MSERATRRMALTVEYDGSAYLGWQAQQDGPTVQSVLTPAVAFVADHALTLTASGRTDTGVHAAAQVVHFDTSALRPPRAWMLGVTTRLPADVAVVDAREVAADFHAQKSAVARRYRYSLLCRPVRPALLRTTRAWERALPEVAAMRAAAAVLLGEHDFTSFRAVQCQSKSPWRRMDAIDIRSEGAELHFEFEANAFLHHQIRNLVGSLLLVGRGERPVEWIAEVLAARDRRRAGPTAPPGGLCYLGPRYPPQCGFPADFSSDKARIDPRRSAPEEDSE
ncbi:MAG: tRNA pseudouridine(38-40) synthase TruA [Xanthomonadales bacterium]|jgi:tRNA pseudouridine38-40 synthase|nr:tRNA pseudouridine(38-40) synthase TruA [Xanthomonadales bacterium]